MNKWNKNLSIWKQVEVTPKGWRKQAWVGGRKLIAVNPQKQLKKATELFGPYGYQWGLKDIDHNVIDLEENKKLIITKAKFFYPISVDGVFETITDFEISNSIILAYMTKGDKKKNKEPYYVVDDEAFKKVETNTISKALSKLGFSSDVFEGRFETAGYEKTVDYAIDEELSEAAIKAAIKVIKSHINSIDLAKFWNTRPDIQQNSEILEIYRDTLQTLQELEQ